MHSSQAPFHSVLIVGSAPDAKRASEMGGLKFDAIVVMNNAWQIRKDWTHLVHPEDFPPERRPVAQNGQAIITHRQYVPANNEFGGVVYAGGTMAFSTAYWVLNALKPSVMAFIGCDMIYDDDKPTHFYGKGDADPLRDDPTLQSLEAKSERLKWHALQQKCLCLNLSERGQSRLTFERMQSTELVGLTEVSLQARLAQMSSSDCISKGQSVLNAENLAQQFVEDGAYWKRIEQLDWKLLADIDRKWLNVFTPDLEV